MIAHRIAVFTLAYFVGVALLVLAVTLAPTRAPAPRPSCDLVDYHDGAWHNHVGVIVATGAEEDSPPEPAGDCR